MRWQALQLYADLGYPVLPLVAKQDVSPLREHLAGHTSVLVGQSGMGKSTIINALLPDAGAAVGDISLALDSGRHTTTHARLYHLGADSALIDSPGMQEFGLMHLSMLDLQHAFVEFRPLAGQCRFNDCRHRGEPGCAIDAAVARGEIDPRRMAVLSEAAGRAGARETPLAALLPPVQPVPGEGWDGGKAPASRDRTRCTPTLPSPYEVEGMAHARRVGRLAKRNPPYARAQCAALTPPCGFSALP